MVENRSRAMGLTSSSLASALGQEKIFYENESAYSVFSLELLKSLE